MRRSLCSGRGPSMIPSTSDFSASYTLSVSLIRCVTEHCGLSVSYHKDKKVSSNVSMCCHTRIRMHTHLCVCIGHLFHIIYYDLSFRLQDCNHL